MYLQPKTNIVPQTINKPQNLMILKKQFFYEKKIFFLFRNFRRGPKNYGHKPKILWDVFQVYTSSGKQVELYCTSHLEYIVQTSKNFEENLSIFGFHLNHKPMIYGRPGRFKPKKHTPT